MMLWQGAQVSHFKLLLLLDKELIYLKSGLGSLIGWEMAVTNVLMFWQRGNYNSADSLYHTAAGHKLSRAHLLTLALLVNLHRTARNHLLLHTPFSTPSQSSSTIKSSVLLDLQLKHHFA